MVVTDLVTVPEMTLQFVQNLFLELQEPCVRDTVLEPGLLDVLGDDSKVTILFQVRIVMLNIFHKTCNALAECVVGHAWYAETVASLEFSL